MSEAAAVAILVDSSLTVSDRWIRILVEYITPLLQRIVENRGGGQNVREKIRLSAMKISWQSVPHRFRVLWNVGDHADTYNRQTILHHYSLLSD